MAAISEIPPSGQPGEAKATERLRASSEQSSERSSNEKEQRSAEVRGSEIVNKVAQSALLTLDLSDWYPKEEIVLFDLKPLLFMEAILKEKEFRAALQNIDWTTYQGKIVAVTCTADAIIPLWAYMLVAVSLEPFATAVVMGNKETALQQVFLSRIAAIDDAAYADKRVIVKGCGDLPIGGYAYMEIARRLRPVVKSIMYGEACSNVPVYKKK